MYRFIVNPVSQSGKGEEIWQLVRARLEELHVEYQVYRTEKQGDMARMAAEAQASGDSDDPIIAIGGDGSLNDVINGLDLAQKPVIGLIPAGSGNDFSAGIGLPRKAMDALDGILGCAAPHLIDAGETVCTVDDVDGGSREIRRNFIVSSGIGYDADVCEQVNVTKLKKFLNRLHLGKLTYFAIGFKLFWTYKKAGGTLTIDGTSQPVSCLGFLSAHNTIYEGGGYPFAPDASPFDGRLSLCVTAPKKRRVFFIAFLLSKTTPGFHTRFKDIFNVDCSEASLSLDIPLPVHTDGEVVGHCSAVTFRVLPGCLRLLGQTSGH